jgi:hypothetical protein
MVKPKAFFLLFFTWWASLGDGYIEVKDNPYILGYLIQVFDGITNCNLPPDLAFWCTADHTRLTIGESIKVSVVINIPYNAPLPSEVGIYMKVENTGQVILIDILTPESGNLEPGRAYAYQEGYEIDPDGIPIRNPLVTYVAVITTFTLQPVMNDVNGNPANVYGPISLFITVKTPSGTYVGEPIDGITVYFPTRIVNFKVSPNPARPGQIVSITGQLQRLTPDGQWAPATNQIVSIYPVANVATDSNGNFGISIQAPSFAGTYTYHAIFYRNDKEFLMVSWAGESLTVVQPTTPKPAPSPSTTTKTPTVKPKLSTGDLAILLGGAGLLTGITAYKLSKKGKA